MTEPDPYIDELARAVVEGRVADIPRLTDAVLDRAILEAAWHEEDR